MKDMEIPKGIGQQEKEKPKSVQELIGEAPDAIMVVPGASKYNKLKDRFEMGSFSDVDDSGVVAGGKDRVIAGVEVHGAYPESALVTMSQNSNPDIPTYSSIQKEALVRMGIPAEQIIEEDQSYRTVDGLKNTLFIAQEKGWKKLVYITSGYHVPRVKEFLMHLAEFSADENEAARLREIDTALQTKALQIQVIGSDEILPFRSGHYEAYLKIVEALPGYQERVKLEEKGVKDIQEGKYVFRGGKK